MNTVSLDWHLIYVRPQQENKIAEHLNGKNIMCFLPRISEVRKWHDRKKIIQMPLFPGYIFVNLNSKHEYFLCQAIEGVCSFVKIGKQPATVRQTVIDQI